MSLPQIQRDVPLAPLTTLELGGPAECFAEVRTEQALCDALRWANDEGCAVTLLAGGSNVIVPDAGVRGLVVAMRLKGLRFDDDGAVTIAAGEPWDAVVAQAVERNLAGIECLSGIPGSSGATPIQNVGAYGQEISLVLTAVRALDLRTLEFDAFDRDACGFTYRDSRFKRYPGEVAITEVTLALTPRGAPTVKYPGLSKELSATPTLAEVRKTVLRVRASKSMVIDPGDPNHRSVGSFFLNPVVRRTTADDIIERCVRAGLARYASDVPAYDAGDGFVKLAAGWLIEKAGIERGMRRGNVGVSSNHSLALVHHGGGTTAELLALANEIVNRVREYFGITLEREPRLLGEA